MRKQGWWLLLPLTLVPMLFAHACGNGSTNNTTTTSTTTETTTTTTTGTNECSDTCDGCCNTGGTCVAFGSQSNTSCGKSGANCASCTNMDTCQATTGGGACLGGTNQCTDMVTNGKETDQDCGGGTCPKCANGKMCLRGSDCVTGFCRMTVNFTCAAVPTTCMDNTKNGSETDQDCGGSSCPGCADGKICKVGTDCVSGVCRNMVCVVVGSGCTNGILDLDSAETDVDCGGIACAGCALGKKCLVNSDCTTNVCNPTTHLCTPGG